MHSIINISLPNYKHRILVVTLYALISLFIISLFSNIAYPLLWNDEAETAMFAERILQYGYPKVHDNKNVVYLMPLPLNIGTQKKSDAYMGAGWGQYYFAAAGAFLARMVDNIYIKTAFLRIPFAIIGFLGLIIMILSVILFLNESPAYKLFFLILFIFFELLSVSLILHLREVRYYSLVILLSACIFYAYINHSIIKKIPNIYYVFLETMLLIFIFNTFSPIYFIFVITIGLYEFLVLLNRGSIKNFIYNVSPLIISAISLLPLAIFFKTFVISKTFASFTHLSPMAYIMRLSNIIYFFKKYEFMYLLLFVKLIMSICWLYKLNNKKENIWIKVRISNFLTLFFIVYILSIIQIPLFLFERYYIVLQPILIIIILLDIFIILETISNINFSIVKPKWIKACFLFLLIMIFIINGFNKIEFIKNHIYELFHQYKGPLDFAIPYIKSNYTNPQNLIIATNYEECAFMYYLGSKVIVGCVGNNLKEDLKLQPDIIIFRKEASYLYNPQIFNIFFQQVSYKKVSFPIFDYGVNNIPELSFPACPHLYKTKMAQNKSECLDMYVK